MSGSDTGFGDSGRDRTLRLSRSGEGTQCGNGERIEQAIKAKRIKFNGVLRKRRRSHARQHDV